MNCSVELQTWAEIGTAVGTLALAALTLVLVVSTTRTNAATAASVAATLEGLKAEAAERDFIRRYSAWLAKKLVNRRDTPSFGRDSVPEDERAFVDRAVVEDRLFQHAITPEALTWR